MENTGAGEFARIGDVGRKELGIPATRAGVTEKLVRGDFVEQKNRLWYYKRYKSKLSA